MKTVISMSAKQSGTMKKFSLGSGCSLYFDPSTDYKVQIAFDEASFEYDLLEQAILLYKDVANRNQMTRGLAAKTPSEMMSVVSQVMKNLPKTISSMEKMNITPRFRKAIVAMLGVQQNAYNKLQDIVSKSE